MYLNKEKKKSQTTFVDVNTLFVSEVFYSLQGEASFTGMPCVFVRLSLCNLRCSWCDTKYSFKKGDSVTFECLKKKIRSFHSQTMPASTGYSEITSQKKIVELTGGEPLLQKNSILFMEELIQENYQVLLETSGSLSIKNVPTDVHIIMDFKAPDSNESGKNLYDNLKYLKQTDDLKIIIASEDDFYWVEDLVDSLHLADVIQKPIILQPEFENFPIEKLAHLILKSSHHFKLGIQLHKFIFGNKQGI